MTVGSALLERFRLSFLTKLDCNAASFSFSYGEPVPALPAMSASQRYDDEVRLRFLLKGWRSLTMAMASLNASSERAPSLFANLYVGVHDK